jgi:hypothetical protein
MARTSPYSKLNIFFGGNSGVKQIPTDSVVSGGVPKDMQNVYSRKFLAVAKESENIQPGNAELERNGV